MYIVEKNKVDNLLNKHRKNTAVLWKYGNEILYNMCKKKPLHNDRNVVASKIWLIGRSYAATIERVKVQISTDDIYDVFLNEVTRNCNFIDNRLEKIVHCKSNLDEKSLSLIFETHLMFTNILKTATQLEKRSLSSKYLHFHCPNAFFIYDSRARRAINSLVKVKRSDIIYTGDNEYMDFYLRMLELQKYLQQKTGRIFTPRELDDFLLFYKG